MKTEQFQYVIELYKTGSISKAAKKFYMSRPNLSNSIRSIEDELGFDILERGVNGVRFTEKGLAFVRHCMSIVKELDEIHTLASKDARLQFGVVNPNYPPVERAFIRLCRAVEEGLDATLFFVVQMSGIVSVSPNDRTHPAFGQALREAAAAGVRICARTCRVGPDRLEMDRPVPVIF